VTAETNIIIIGAGLIGLCTADALAARGARVHIIDVNSGPCEGTSYSNSGMIHPSQAYSWSPETAPTLEIARACEDAAYVSARLAERSKQILLGKMKSLGLPIRREGCLQLHADIESAREAQLEYNKLGIEADVLMNPVDTFGMAACHFTDDSSGDAYAFGCALADDLTGRGVSFTYDAADLDIKKADGQFYVKTSKGVFEADHLIVAAGSGSPACLEKLGIRLRIDAVAGAAADFALPEDLSDFPFCPIMDIQSRSALTVFEDRVRISGGWNITDPAPLLDRWRDIAPGLMFRLGDPLRTWTGKRPVSPVGRPYISGTSIPNLWVNTGHGHMGWTLSAGSGELLAEMILNGVVDGRFAFAG